LLGSNVWRTMLGVYKATVIESVELDEETNAVVAHVRARKATKRRCGRCGVRAPGYDRGEGRRRWRTLDLGVVMTFLEADSPRVNCPEHGPTVAQVPWARHGAGHTRDLDDEVAWLVTHTAKSTVCELLRVAWRTVGSIISRVVDDGRAAHDPFEGLTRIGIDEISYKRGHRYLTICVDHDSGRLVWAAVGRDKKTLRAFFDLLGSERCAKIRLVSADAAEWIGEVVAERCVNAMLCIDSFHVIQWCTDALERFECPRIPGSRQRACGVQRHRKEGAERHALHLLCRRSDRYGIAVLESVEGLERLPRCQLESVQQGHPDRRSEKVIDARHHAAIIADTLPVEHRTRTKNLGLGRPHPRTDRHFRRVPPTPRWRAPLELRYRDGPGESYEMVRPVPHGCGTVGS
jgi:transposase